MLIARESINFNGAKLTPEIFSAFELTHQEISEQQNMIDCLLQKAADNEDGYNIRHAYRITPKLYSIGLSELEVAAMDFKTILKYEAAISVIENEFVNDQCSFNTHKSEIFQSDREDRTGGMLLNIQAASKEFHQMMYSYFATIIRADIVRADIKRRVRQAQRSEEVTVNFDVAVLTNATVDETVTDNLLNRETATDEPLQTNITENTDHTGNEEQLCYPILRVDGTVTDGSDTEPATDERLQTNITENTENPEPSNYTFLMNILASPITKGIAVVILVASFILLGVVTAGLRTIPIAVGIAGVCSGAILLGGSLWASKRMQQDPDLPDAPQKRLGQ